MSQLLYGSLNYDALLKAVKSGRVKVFKTESGVRLININVWVNDEPDKYDNDASIQVQLKDEFKEEKADYVGNLRKYVKKELKEGSSEDFNDDDDLPF
ncbi:hypothetical protein U9K52_09985 [Chryseobacterium sp. MHB01]|uniref:hypothetical protein n=1 Tax=Chryseobacterium sp. MHB01 TaxID=3109433 RepID=UPI002AFDF45F|nr:hypothetical protein [Chryseobacterium sp. MHB01]MEA1849242.1 hypothetical protein [Chryseobacterium sp. MHB01]